MTCPPKSAPRPDYIFADDCLLYRTFTTEADASQLQAELEKESDWQMHFNSDKCEVIRITTMRKHHPLLHPYGMELANTSKAKYRYLGVNIENNLSWNHYIDSVCKKANKTVAFLGRNISPSPAKIKDMCYKTLIISQVEYASTVWDPQTKRNINNLLACYLP